MGPKTLTLSMMMAKIGTGICQGCNRFTNAYSVTEEARLTLTSESFERFAKGILRTSAFILTENKKKRYRMLEERGDYFYSKRMQLTS